jgi:hypothetical protein
VLHGDRARLLGYDPAEHPLAIQLGGSDPLALAQCVLFDVRPRQKKYFDFRADLGRCFGASEATGFDPVSL